MRDGTEELGMILRDVRDERQHPDDRQKAVCLEFFSRQCDIS